MVPLANNKLIRETELVIYFLYKLRILFHYFVNGSIWLSNGGKQTVGVKMESLNSFCAISRYQI